MLKHPRAIRTHATQTHTRKRKHTHTRRTDPVRILRARRSPHTCDPSLIVQAKPAIGSRTSFSYTALSRFESDLQAAKRRGHACATCKQLGQQSEHVVREPRRVHEPARAPNRYRLPHPTSRGGPLSSPIMHHSSHPKKHQSIKRLYVVNPTPKRKTRHTRFSLSTRPKCRATHLHASRCPSHIQRHQLHVRSRRP